MRRYNILKKQSRVDLGGPLDSNKGLAQIEELKCRIGSINEKERCNILQLNTIKENVNSSIRPMETAHHHLHLFTKLSPNHSDIKK